MHCSLPSKGGPGSHPESQAGGQQEGAAAVSALGSTVGSGEWETYTCDSETYRILQLA